VTSTSVLDRSLALLAGCVNRLLPLRERRYHAYHATRLDADVVYPLGAWMERTEAEVAGSFKIPEGDSVFLVLNVTSTRFGTLRDPFIEVRAGGRSLRQYVERGVNAKRLINVTALSGCTDAQLFLTDLALKDTSAQWLVSKRRPIEGTLLVLAPHPDDAELSSFSLYSSRPAWVVTTCAGEVGTHDYGGLFTHDAEGSKLRGTLRVAASLSAPLAGGVPPGLCANLGYFDDTLPKLFRDRSRPASSATAATDDLSTFRRSGGEIPLPTRAHATWEGLVDDLVTLLEASGASAVAFPHPMLDEHPDHAYLGLAAMEALLRHGREVALLSYVVHGPGGALGLNIHPVGRRDGMVSPPPIQVSEPLFDGILSQGLSPDQQRRKALALDHYSDLKHGDGPLPLEDAETRVKAALREIYRSIFVYDLGLLRRFIRPNELFYLLDWSKLSAYHAAFQKARREADKPAPSD
jgi:hypothetical protein